MIIWFEDKLEITRDCKIDDYGLMQVYQYSVFFIPLSYFLVYIYYNVDENFVSYQF